MKKIFLLLFVAAALVTTVKAQKPKIEMSGAFDEPEDGWNKVMQLKNGNTFFFHFTKKEGIEEKVYNPQRKPIGSHKITSQKWDPENMKRSQIVGLYEMNGQVVLFLEQLIDRTPTLFRIILDGQTGAKVKDDKLGELDHYGAFAGYAMTFGGGDGNNAYVEKDPNSDCYAVVYFNGLAHETDKRIEVVHYDASHKEINRAFFTSPEGMFKYTRYIGMTVDGDKNLYMCTYCFNKGGDKDSRIVLSKLGKSDKTFTNNMLEFSEDFKDTRAVMQYNPGTKLIQLLSATKTDSKSQMFTGKHTTYYLIMMSYIDPEKLSIVSAKPLGAKKVSEYMQSKLDRDDFVGLPQQMVFNSDNSTTLMMEEMTHVETNYHGMISYSTTLQNIGISDLNTKGEETNGYGILKSQHATGLIPELYMAERGKGYWSYRTGGPMKIDNNAFMSYDYVSTSKGRYVLFNDYAENIDKDEKKKRKTVLAISDANTICYKLNNGVMEKFYLFGDPKDEDKAKFCYIESSSFLKETNTYATLLISREGRDKQARVAWVTFE